MTKNRLKIICPECADNLVKDLDNSSYYCKNCNSNFSIYQVYGYEIIDFVSNDLKFTKGFSAEDDMLMFKKLLNVFDEVDFYGLVKIYQTLSSTSDDNNFKMIIPKPKSINEYDLNHGKDSLRKVESISMNMGKQINYDGVALENGSGYGFFCYEFAKRFKYLYVTDCSMCYLLLGIKFIIQNQKIFSDSENLIEKVSFCRCNIEKLPLSNNSVDFIHSNQVIEHVSNQQKYLEEMNRVVQEDLGLVYVVSPNRYSALPEPHYRLRFFGLYPNVIANYLLRHRNLTTDAVIPLSLKVLRNKLKVTFEKNFIIIGFFQNLSIANPSKLKNMISNLGKLNFVNYLLNNILIVILPCHYILASKKKS